MIDRAIDITNDCSVFKTVATCMFDRCTLYVPSVNKCIPISRTVLNPDKYNDAQIKIKSIDTLFPRLLIQSTEVHMT